MMPESERDPGPDPEEYISWDCDRDAPMWTDDVDDNGIQGVAAGVANNEGYRKRRKRK